MTGLTLVKFGGSVVTDKAGRERLREGVLARLCREFAAAGSQSCVVGHGSGSFGHRAAVEHGCADGVFASTEEQAAIATRTAALRLHRQVLAALGAAGVEVVSLPPAEWCSWRGESLQADPEPVRGALARGAVPLVMGDVVRLQTPDGSWAGARIASTEEVFLGLAPELPVARAVWLVDTDGVLDEDGVTLAELAPAAQPSFGASPGSDVTGGMELKWRAVQRLAALGVESLLINGLRDGELERALTGGDVRGTRVVPARSSA